MVGFSNERDRERQTETKMAGVEGGGEGRVKLGRRKRKEWGDREDV